MADIVGRLLEAAKYPGRLSADDRDTCREAADEIERLRNAEKAYDDLFKRSCEKTLYIVECETEIERLRGSR
jgi:hypothetical protein